MIIFYSKRKREENMKKLMRITVLKLLFVFCAAVTIFEFTSCKSKVDKAVSLTKDFCTYISIGDYENAACVSAKIDALTESFNVLESSEYNRKTSELRILAAANN